MLKESHRNCLPLLVRDSPLPLEGAASDVFKAAMSLHH